jgi:hypothetical protein
MAEQRSGRLRVLRLQRNCSDISIPPGLRTDTREPFKSLLEESAPIESLHRSRYPGRISTLLPAQRPHRIDRCGSPGEDISRQRAVNPIDLRHDIIITGRRGATSSFKEVRYAIRLSDRHL